MSDVEDIEDAEGDDPVFALLEAAYFLEEGTAKIALAEEAVRLAEMSGDDEKAEPAREFLIEAAIFGGRPDVALVTFSRSLAFSDAHSDDTDLHQVLWKYKWILGNLDTMPQVTKGQIEQSLQDFGSRCEAGGFTTYAADKLRWALAISMGDVDGARAAFDRFEKAKRDDLGDCIACVQDEIVRHFAFIGDPERALQAAEPVLKRKMQCKEIPHRTYARVLEPMFELGQWEKAADCHRKGLRLIQRNPEFLEHQAQHMTFLCLTANFTKALTSMAQYLPSALAAIPLNQLAFLRSALFTLMCAGRQGTQTVKIVLPESISFFRPDGNYPLSELHSALRPLAVELATQFDARNGNRWQTEQLTRLASLTDSIRPYEIRSTVRKKRNPAAEESE
jgi:hypothetical protein